MGIAAAGIVFCWPSLPTERGDDWNEAVTFAGVRVVVPTIREARRINVNTADPAELVKLPGIGEVFAARIVAYRREHGPFKSVDDLAPVSGIVAQTIAGFREMVTVGDASD
jgi:competence ComEA-like helix-hairpin-helix protein